MFFKKKHTPKETNPYDTQYRALWELRRDARDRLFFAVDKSLTKSLAVMAYSESADKDRAIKDAESAKQEVVNKIAEYKLMYATVDKFWQENKQYLDECRGWDPSGMKRDAHELVEYRVERFFGSGR